MIGIDYNGTITASPKIFKRLATSLLNTGYPVYIISAVRQSNIQKTMQLIRHSKVPHTAIEIVVFENFEDIPQLKLAACQRLGIKFMFDDLPEVTELLSQHRILMR